MTPHATVPEPVMVTAREHLAEIVPELRESPRLALDIESNGFYVYREKVCLLQVSSPGTDYIIDPIAVPDLSGLAPLMADPAIEKIFHAGEYDVLCLKRDHGFEFKNLFDTMVACRLLGVKELGLAAAIERHFGVRLSKKLQRADWGRRPLTREQVLYAQLDTHYLMRLADILKVQIAQKGRAEDAAEAFQELEEVTPVVKVFDPEGFWSLIGRERFSERQLAVLREVYIFREEAARSRDRAPFRVMPEEVMVRIAHAVPDSREDLAGIRGMTPYLMQKYGPGILKAVHRGREARPPVREPRERPSRGHAIREQRVFEALRQWRKGEARAEEVEPVVVVSSEVLREIARLAIEGAEDPLEPLSPLKRGRYGEKILHVIKPRAHA